MGQRKGYKQTQEHINKRKRFGKNHPNWKGDRVSIKSGRTRALRLYKKESCELCGEYKKRIDRHHIDGNTSNNDRSNIKFMCRKCHMREDGRLGKFIEQAKINQPYAVAKRWNKTILQ